MPKITISYRRADTEGSSGRIRDWLAIRYGDQNIFMDIDLEYGEEHLLVLVATAVRG